MTACAASPTAAMSSSEMSIADPGKEIRYFVIVCSSGCEFPDKVLFLDFRPFNHQRHYLPGRIGNRRTAAPAVYKRVLDDGAAGRTCTKPFFSSLPTYC